MTILGIETSCDETAAAVLEGKPDAKSLTIRSNIVSSSIKLHSKTGGIIPETAAREQLKVIIPVVDEAIKKSEVDRKNIDAIAVTIGPGLVGSLLVGVETAKTLAYVWDKPIVPVNHLIGHIYANFIGEIPNQPIQFPALALIVSGGHTDLVLMKDHGNIKWLGGTRDDAAGEAFDKIGRMLNLPYPAGAVIEKLSERGDPSRFTFPRPMIDSRDFDFSFSGLKTAAYRQIKTIEQLASPQGGLNDKTISDMCASLQQAIIDVLVKKTLKAAQQYNVRSILLGGGVAANQKLRDEFSLKIKLFVPTKSLCTDNAAMIASIAFYNYKPVPWQQITANPELYFNSA